MAFQPRIAAVSLKQDGHFRCQRKSPELDEPPIGCIRFTSSAIIVIFHTSGTHPMSFCHNPKYLLFYSQMK